MRIRSLKLLLWLLNGVITIGIVGAVFLFVVKPPSPVGQGLREDLEAIRDEAEANRRVEGEAARLKSEYQAVWKANLRALAPELPPQEIVEQTDKPRDSGPKLDSIVALEMIIGDSSTLRYKRPLRDKENDEDIKAADARSVRVNERIPGVEPAAVIKAVFGLERKIEVAYSGKTVTLEIEAHSPDLSVALEGGVPGAAPTRTAFAPAGAKKPSEDRSSGPIDPNRTEGYETRPGSGMWMIPETEAGRLVDEAGDILEQATLSSYRDPQGRAAGIRLDRVDQGSLILDRGFQEGDIVQKVNGQSVNSKTELVDWVKRNHERYSMFRVELQRRGQVKRLNFRVQTPRR